MSEIHFDKLEVNQEIQEYVIQKIINERGHQDHKWGIQRHSPELWMAILMEEVGEAAKEILEEQFSGYKSSGLYSELVQVAAVAIAILEQLEEERRAKA